MKNLQAASAALLALLGLWLAIFGNTWGPPVYEILDASEPGIWLGLVIPFLPMAFIGAAAAIFVHSRRG